LSNAAHCAFHWQADSEFSFGHLVLAEDEVSFARLGGIEVAMGRRQVQIKPVG
jgi:hypothetical protein